ncbi:MAG: ABC transporter ATP-binding protein [Pseudomonadota bacterium]
MSAYLRIEDLHVALGGDPEKRLLRGVSLDVAPGEVHGLVGESGAGKSMIGKTVFGILPRAVRVIGGRIDVGGRDLLTLRKPERRRLVGSTMALIPQDPLTALNPARRIGAQMTDRLVATLGHSKADALARARAMLDEVHIRDPDRVLASYPHELSGGMRQRVLIAEAFAAEPKLIVADEPTTALDVTVQKQILKLIAEMQAAHGTAMLFVTHDLGVVAKLCQSVTVLYSGQTVEQGRTADLIAAPQTAYTAALLAAVPRYDRPGQSLRPVDPAVTAAVAEDVARADAAYLAERVA